MHRILKLSIAACYRSILAGAAFLSLSTGALGSIPDYELLDELLLQNVRDGLVDYDSLARDSRFGRFIAQLADAEPGDLRERDDALAFYINAYNAFAIKTVLDGQSPESRGDRNRLLRRAKHRLLGEEMSLEELEQERLAGFDEPRIHFVLVPASLAGARLWNRAYRPEVLAEQLDTAARRFINDRTRNRFDLAKRIAFLSPVFEANREEFESPGISLQRYLSRYVEDADAASALRRGVFAVQYQEPDWLLNGHRTANDEN